MSVQDARFLVGPMCYTTFDGKPALIEPAVVVRRHSIVDLAVVAGKGESTAR